MKPELEHSTSQSSFSGRKRSPSPNQRGDLLERSYTDEENKKSTFLLESLKFLPSHGAHSTYGNKWGTAMAWGEAFFSFGFCLLSCRQNKVWAVVKALFCPTAVTTQWVWFKFVFLTLISPGHHRCCATFALIGRTEKVTTMNMDLITKNTVCYTEPHWTQDYFWTTVHPLHSYISSCFKARQGRAVWSYPTPPFSWPVACRDLCCGKATVSPSEDAEAERWFLLTCWVSVIPTATGVLGWSHTYCSASHATTINTEQIGE